MIKVTLGYLQVERLMDSMLWVLAPYMENNSIKDYPWLIELADCYNELYQQIPSVENYYEFISY